MVFEKEAYNSVSRILSYYLFFIAFSWASFAFVRMGTARN